MSSSISTRSLPEEVMALSLLNVLSNPLILYHTAALLPISARLALGATCTAFRELIHETPNVFRYLDLTTVKAAHFEIPAIDHGGQVWRNVQLDEHVTEDDFWAGPLRGIFANLQRGNILKDVQTLILDGLSVPAELISEMILNDSYHIRILSIREVKNLNEQKLMQVLRYAVRPSRSKNTPRLEGLYVFGRREPPPVIKDFKRHVNRYPPGIAPLDTIPQYGGVMSSQGAQIGAEWNLKSQEALSDCLNHTNQGWYIKTGKLFARQLTHTMNQDWAATILACKGIIQFDAVLCPGPRHSTDSPHMRKLSTHSRDGEAAEYSPVWYNRLDAYISPSVALVSVRGCAICGISPEGITIYGKSETSRFPLLAPPPLHASTLKSAIHPPPISSGEKGRLIVRCSACMSGRYCESCHKWWCEDCYQIEDDEKKPRHPNTPTNGGKALLPPDAENVKVHMGFCVADCLVGEMMAGAGSGGMWG